MRIIYRRKLKCNYKRVENSDELDRLTFQNVQFSTAGHSIPPVRAALDVPSSGHRTRESRFPTFERRHQHKTPTKSAQNSDLPRQHFHPFVNACSLSADTQFTIIVYFVSNVGQLIYTLNIGKADCLPRAAKRLPESASFHYNLIGNQVATNEERKRLTTATRAILFDLDGTLIDTTDLILRCFSHSWRAVYGLEHQRAALVATFGIPLREAMRRLLAQTSDSPGDPDEALVERLLIEYRLFNVANHDVIARPFEGTRAVVETLRRRGYLIGLVTSKGRDLAMRGLRLCALDEMMDAAIFLEDTETHKPQPGPILAALARLQIAPAEAAYVGDSCHDIVAGHRAGVKTVAALWGPLPRADLECERPDHLADSIKDLLNIFP